MRIYDFTVEGQNNPMDISISDPRFSWKIESDEKNTVQKSYQLVVKKLAEDGDERPVWDSGCIDKSTSIFVPYEGAALEDETDYRARLTVTDNHGNYAEAELSFSTGIMDATTLNAQMITHDFPEKETACPVFYKDVTLTKSVKRAWLYATAFGVYVAYIDGDRIGDAHFAPGWTDYKKRLQYQTMDVTENFRDGAKHRLEILVGNGWYKGILGFDVKPNRYGDRTAAFAELHIEYADGTRETISTDSTWGVATDEVRMSELYMGETINTWNPACAFGSVKIVPFDKSILVAQEDEPVRITDRLPVQKIFTAPNGDCVADFGQNMTGAVELHITGQPGQRVQLDHAETLDKDGNFYPETLRLAKSEDVFILNGEEQILFPHFTFHGFRYIRIHGIKNPKPEMFTACAMHTDLKRTGHFSCSNKLVNRMAENVYWSQVDNFLDIPTDCPQRDERLGWMGDAQVFAPTASINCNTDRFFSKWMRDVAADSSLEKGVPHVVPDILGQYSAAAWSDAAVIVPWTVYETYGDKRILEENWTCMHEWVDYIRNHTEKSGLWKTGFQYGDWLGLDMEIGGDRSGATDRYLVANAYYIYVTDLVRKTAEVLGLTAEAEKYSKLYAKTLKAFQDEYYTKTGRIVSETQTACVLSLYFNLAREKDRAQILTTLENNIANHKNHLTTGFVGTPYLLHALSENGSHEAAAAVFMKQDYPSWLYEVKMGATTIWERWNSIHPDGSFDESGMNSLNHYAYGAVEEWMYKKVAGITALEPGYRKFQIRPLFVKGIEQVDASIETVYGEIKVSYSCKDGKISLAAKVPANTSCELYLPEKEGVVLLGSGEYTYAYETKTSLKVERFTMDTTLGEVVAEPLAKQMFNQMVPGMLDQPMIQYAYGMTMSELTAAAPEAAPMYQAVLAALNQAEEEKNAGV